MSYSIQDLRDWATLLRRLADKWPDDARGDILEQLCGKAGLYLGDAWEKGFFQRAAWVELREWLYKPDRVTAFDFYCRSVEFLWWGWDNARWTKDAGWLDRPEDRPEKADMPRLVNVWDTRVSFQSSDGKLLIDSGAPRVNGPPASMRVLRQGCIVWATIFEREADGSEMMLAGQNVDRKITLLEGAKAQRKAQSVRSRGELLRLQDSPSAILGSDHSSTSKQIPASISKPAEDEASDAGGLTKDSHGTRNAVHSADYTFVNWFGTKYTFALGVQSSAVKALWDEWEKTGLGLHQDTIREAIDPERDTFRLDGAFRNHPAFGTMIQRCGDGKYKLALPNDDKAPDRKVKKSTGITPRARRKHI